MFAFWLNVGLDTRIAEQSVGWYPVGGQMIGPTFNLVERLQMPSKTLPEIGRAMVAINELEIETFRIHQFHTTSRELAVFLDFHSWCRELIRLK